MLTSKKAAVTFQWKVTGRLDIAKRNFRYLGKNVKKFGTSGTRSQNPCVVVQLLYPLGHENLWFIGIVNCFYGGNCLVR